MEEMMMVMMKISTHPNNNLNIPIPIPVTTSASPTWKLYENPFYISHQKPDPSPADHKQIHRLHLPVSARKIAASFWDLTFIKPFTESELEMARTEITELKAELQRERKSRKKTESLNKRMETELHDERKGRQALEKVCEKLAQEISINKGEIMRMQMEIEEERKMLRTAEVIREERVQMKLMEAKNLLEERLSELEVSKKQSFGEKMRLVLGANSVNSVGSGNGKGCGEVENHHIRRGIRGFVEFPKVVRAIGCRSSGKNLGSKLESQKAQLKILLKQKGSGEFSGLIGT